LPRRRGAAIRDVLIPARLLGLFLILVGGGVGLPVPEDLTLLGAGVLAHRRILRLRDVIAVGFAGVVTADWIIYLAGRRYGPGFVAHPWLARLSGAARMDAVRHAVERHGARAVFFARFLLGFRIATFLGAGTFGVSAPRFAVAEAAGSAIFVPAMATLGFLFSDRAERVARNVGAVQHWLLLAGLVGLGLYLALRAWATRTGLGGDGPLTTAGRPPDEAGSPPSPRPPRDRLP
jgi:membrane protein DedA with SNARE-associated domain